MSSWEQFYSDLRALWAGFLGWMVFVAMAWFALVLGVLWLWRHV